ncbi:transposase [Rubripirellula reticaptiva]|uniref:Transposase DDE domain protein n=1 Tax=Rubripirellula reticaptiva TaxID=2528013 RepID=A0A5C6F1G3_9BACT|nr:transposase [Rubripirellula reticaptiva]TWU55092.1 Transposase DDE domain protein [Rubripirellula reticaptiva]
MTSQEGLPLEVIVSGANEHDVNFILPLVYLGLPRVGGRPGRPREYPNMVRADCGYTSKDVLVVLDATGIDAEIPQRGQDALAGLGKRRWPVERAIAWLKQFRRVGVRRDRLAETHEAFVTLACEMIAFGSLPKHGL